MRTRRLGWSYFNRIKRTTILINFIITLTATINKTICFFNIIFRIWHTSPLFTALIFNIYRLSIMVLIFCFRFIILQCFNIYLFKVFCSWSTATYTFNILLFQKIIFHQFLVNFIWLFNNILFIFKFRLNLWSLFI